MNSRLTKRCSQPLAVPMTLIEIRPYCNGWKVFAKLSERRKISVAD
jgi:hypothetical protein